MVALERDFMAPRIVGDQIVGCGFDGKSVEVDAKSEEVLDYSFGRGIACGRLGQWRVSTHFLGQRCREEVQEAHGICRHWGRFVHMNPERGRSMDVRWYDLETKKLMALPMKFSSSEETDMESRLRLSSDAGYTYVTLTFGPEDCPLI